MYDVMKNREAGRTRTNARMENDSATLQDISLILGLTCLGLSKKIITKWEFYSVAILFGAGDSTPDFGLAFQVQLGTEFRVTLMNYHHQRKLFTLFSVLFFLLAKWLPVENWEAWRVTKTL